VFQSSGPQQEAGVFYDLNKTRTSINAISMYRALLRQSEATSVAIQELLDKYGFTVAKNGKRAFGAASAIREVYKRGVLDDVLQVIDDAFGDGSSVRWRMMFAQSHFIQMLGLIYQVKGKEVDKARMSLVLARMDEKAYTRLSSGAAGTTGSRAKRIAPAFIDEFYNKSLSPKNRIVW
jgi:RNase P/RNase MRP subunit POP5